MMQSDSRPKVGCRCRLCIRSRAEPCLCLSEVGLGKGRLRAGVGSSARQPHLGGNEIKHLLFHEVAGTVFCCV